jgi:hypothetical protein
MQKPRVQKNATAKHWVVEDSDQRHLQSIKRMGTAMSKPVDSLHQKRVHVEFVTFRAWNCMWPRLCRFQTCSVWFL